MPGEETELKIKVAHYESERDFGHLADEIVRQLETDPRFPTDSVYAIKHRFKAPDRLIEKIRAEIAKGHQVDETNYREFVRDLLGIRIVTLRISQKLVVAEYIDELCEEGLFELHNRKKMATFSDVANHAAQDEDWDDPQYTGYSSIHYQLSLGDEVAKRIGIDGPVEVQIRTIFEEAWGEVDHKFRYELARSGVDIPTHVHTGFRDLSHYLLSVARHAEHLCEDIDSAAGRPPTQGESEAAASAEVERIKAELDQSSEQTAELVARLQFLERQLVDSDGQRELLSAEIERRFRFVPRESTLRHILARLGQHGTSVETLLEGLDTDTRLTARFKEIFAEELGYDAFDPDNTLDMDIIPLVNFVLMSAYQAVPEAEAGLRSVLRRRNTR